MTKEEYLIGILRGFTCTTNDERYELLHALKLYGCISVHNDCCDVAVQFIMNDMTYEVGQPIFSWSLYENQSRENSQ